MEFVGTPPNGGWGWMVVLGAALINMVNQALFANFGLIFGKKLNDLSDGKATGIMMVLSGSVLVTNFSGLLVGPLMKRLSIRSITILGILCVGTGMICSSFSTEIWEIILGYSCLTGLGLGLLASVTFLAINSYFTTKKSTAVGLAMAGTSVGQMVFPTFIGILLEKYDFSGTALFLGLLSYTGILGAILFKPIFLCGKGKDTAKNTIVEKGLENDHDVNFNDDMKDTSKESEKRLMEDDDVFLEVQKPLTKKGSAAIISNGLEANYKDSAIAMANSTDLTKCDKQETTFANKIVRGLGLQLLKDLSFVHIVIGLSFGYLSTVTFTTFFPMFLEFEVVLTMRQTTSCMTALSFADIVGRITVSELCRKLKLGNKSSFMVGCILLAICRSSMVLMTEFKYIFVMSFFIGYFRAVTVINQNLVISEYIEKDKLPSAVGLNMMFKGILIVTAGHPLGLMKDAFSYALCIHLLNIILFIVVTSWTLETIVKKCRRN